MAIDAVDAVDDVEMMEIAATPAAGVVIGPFAVGYAPDPNAAFTVTPGALGAEGVFTATGPAFGPYPAMATEAGGVYSLTGTIGSEVPIGEVSIQPGDLSGGVFTPIGPAITGTLGTQAQAALDWDVVLTGPFTSVILDSAAALPATATAWVYLGIQVADVLTAAAVTLAGNPNALSLAVAVVRQDPQPSDWQPAQVVTTIGGEEYLALKVGPAGTLSLTMGLWDAWAQIITPGETIQLKAPGGLTVQ